MFGQDALRTVLHPRPTGEEPSTSGGYRPPPLPRPPAREMRGPTPWCNWAIKGQVLAGAFPASIDDQETNEILRTLLELGVTTFVCLQSEFSIDVPEREWRTGRALRPYIHDAQRILRMAHENGYGPIKQRKIDFLHLPIDDGGVTSDTAMDKLAEDCIERVKRGEKLYIHCWGGHGRTGTLVAVMLGRIYGISYAAALHCTQTFHDARRFPQGVRSPSTAVQRAQVRRLLGTSTQPLLQRTSSAGPLGSVPPRTGTAPSVRASSPATPRGGITPRGFTPAISSPVSPRQTATAPGRAGLASAATRQSLTARSSITLTSRDRMDQLSRSIESLKNLSLSAGKATAATAKSVSYKPGSGRPAGRKL